MGNVPAECWANDMHAAGTELLQIGAPLTEPDPSQNSKLETVVDQFFDYNSSEQLDGFTKLYDLWIKYFKI